MQIPKRYQSDDAFWAWMKSMACIYLEQLGFPNHRLPNSQTGDLANECISKTFIWIRKPSVQVVGRLRSFEAFFLDRLKYEAKTIRNKHLQVKARETALDDFESVDAGEGESGASSLSPIDRVADSGLSPLELAMRRQERLLTAKCLRAIREEVRQLIKSKKISRPYQACCFYKVVRAYLQEPWKGLGFDTHRQEVEQSCRNTPTKQTANRWWLFVQGNLANSGSCLERPRLKESKYHE